MWAEDWSGGAGGVAGRTPDDALAADRASLWYCESVTKAPDRLALRMILVWSSTSSVLVLSPEVEPMLTVVVEASVLAGLNASLLLPRSLTSSKAYELMPASTRYVARGLESWLSPSSSSVLVFEPQSMYTVPLLPS